MANKKKKNIIQKIFTLPYDTLDVYKKINYCII